MKQNSRKHRDTNATRPSSLFDELLITDSESVGADACETVSPSAALRAVPRVKRPIRDQVEFRDMCIDDLVPQDHQVRAVWTFVMAQDLSSLYDTIAAVEGEVGRDAIDPRILMALWLFATIDAVGSAREIARLTERDNPYQWICGGVSVNHDRLSRFRTGSTELLDDVLTNSVAVLMEQNLVDLKRVAQDGMRVRANAGKSSFRGEKTLQELHAVAVEHLANLRTGVDENPSQASARQKAARLHAAEDREDRIAKALAALPKLAAAREKRKKGDGATTRVSTTDVEARTMKMANGGFNPAYNVQFATDTASGIIVGIDVNSEGSDAGLMKPMVEQIQERHGRTPEEMLVDGGFMMVQDTIDVTRMGVVIYMPVKEESKKRQKGIDPFAPIATDAPEVAAWRQRMGQAESKEIYKERASTAEWVNAQARNRGCQQFRVRGQKKVKDVGMWFAIVHNLLQGLLLYAMRDQVDIAQQVDFA
jgi:transposase